ncbi:hypothetical protein PR048_021722 [Dryococelus australis]|uniref:Uncharacterized protein n=1 Tax=Dryococelus australis TaxID=614101 RepID=A0ABQ9GZ72_9NEOP|nr:hypothetical protein PR048_021722 [Dryococelus australis]
MLLAVKPSVNAYLQAGEFKNDGLYATDAQTLTCRHCNSLVTYEKCDNVVKHIKTARHETATNKLASTSGNKVQTSVVASFNSAKRRKVAVDNLALKTTEAFAKANIPVEKLEDPNLISWMCEFIEGVGELPYIRTLREKNALKLAQERADSLKDLVQGRKVFILCDETTGSKGRCRFVVLFKIFFLTTWKIHLKVASLSIFEKVDATTFSQVFNECVQKYSIQFSDIKGVVTDSAQCMTKCVSSLQTLFGVCICTMLSTQAGIGGQCHVLCTARFSHLVSNASVYAVEFVVYVSICSAEYLLDIISFTQGDKVENSGTQYLVSLSSKLKKCRPKCKDLNTTKDILPTIKCIPQLKDIEDSLLFKEYELLKEAVLEVATSEQVCDVPKILAAVGTEQKLFAAKALQAIWIPPSNVDSECLLSHCNQVVTDRCQNLKD